MARTQRKTISLIPLQSARGVVTNLRRRRADRGVPVVLALLLLVTSFPLVACGETRGTLISIDQLRAAFSRHDLRTYLVYDRERSNDHSYSAFVPALVPRFPWKRFAPAYALVTDRNPKHAGTFPESVQTEIYVFSTTAAADSASHACVGCLSTRNVVIEVRSSARKRVQAVLTSLRGSPA